MILSFDTNVTALSCSLATEEKTDCQGERIDSTSNKLEINKINDSNASKMFVNNDINYVKQKSRKKEEMNQNDIYVRNQEIEKKTINENTLKENLELNHLEETVRVYVHLLCVVGIKPTQSLGDLHLVDKVEQNRKKDFGKKKITSLLILIFPFVCSFIDYFFDTFSSGPCTLLCI